jgi:hypothetical protein
MKFKITLTTLSVAIALILTALDAFPQNNIFSGPQNLGAILNSADMDQLPVIAPNGLSLYFGSNRAGGLGGQDIYVSQRAALSSAWGAPVNVGVLNTNSNDTPSTFSADGRELFMQSIRPGGTGGVDIYISTRTDPNNDSGWSTPVNIGTVINTAANDYFGNYFVNPATGSATLFFNSDRAGGLGGNDIYQSTRNADGSFNTPTAIPELNSAFSEERTAISRDGLEFYLSSNRLVPTTNQVIFVATRASLAAAWSAPAPVAGLNAAGSNAQPSLSPDGAILYFTSNRSGGFGLGDLYSAVRCSLYSVSPCVVNRNATGDFDGDGRTDLSIFRPADGTWHVFQSGSNTYRVLAFGANGDRIVPGDYDGDSRTDLAVFRPSTGGWWIQKSSDNSVSVTIWGLATDKLVPADYDGDSRIDIAVYRDGAWYIIQSSNGNISYQQFGAGGDIPVFTANAQ